MAILKVVVTFSPISQLFYSQEDMVSLGCSQAIGEY